MGRIVEEGGKRTYIPDNSSDFGPKPNLLPSGDIVWADGKEYEGPYGIPGIDKYAIQEAYDQLFTPTVQAPIEYGTTGHYLTGGEYMSVGGTFYKLSTSPTGAGYQTFRASGSSYLYDGSTIYDANGNPVSFTGTYVGYGGSYRDIIPSGGNAPGGGNLDGIVGGSSFLLNLNQLPAGYNPMGLGAQAITDMVNHKSGFGYIDSRYKLLQYDPGSGNISPLNLPITDDVTHSDLAVTSCKIDMQTTRDVHRSIDLELYEVPGFVFDPLIHLVQPFVTYYDQFDHILLDIPMGIFTVVLPQRDISDSINTWKMTGTDMTQWVANTGFLNNYTIPAGSSYIAAIYRMLTMDFRPMSIGGSGSTPQGCDDAGPHIPISRIDIQDVGFTNDIPTTLPVDIIFTPKENKLSAINSLLKAINYYPLYVDEVGVFRSSPMPYWTEAIPVPSWTYDTDVDSIIIPPVTQSFPNENELANICEVWVENTSAQPIYAIEINDNPSSAISLSRMGRAIVKQIQDDKIPDQYTAWLRAITELQYAATLNEQVEFSAFINPFHRVHDYLVLNIRKGGSVSYVDGEVVFAQDGPMAITTTTYPFEEIQWSADLQNMTVKHTLGRLVAV